MKNLYRLERGDAGDVEKGDRDINAKGWDTVTVRPSLKAVLFDLIGQLNDDDLVLTDSFLRLIDCNKKQVIS